MPNTIKPISACSRHKGDVYRLLNMVHVMAGRAAVTTGGKEWWLARTQSDLEFGPIMTVWTNGIVEIEASTFSEDNHVYHLRPVKKEDSQ